jgi:hypothetical protein
MISQTPSQFEAVVPWTSNLEPSTVHFKNYFPVDFHVKESEILTYRAQPPGNLTDECFLFDSLRPLNLLLKNLLTIRVTCLNDATLLGFRVPHHLCDGESVYHVIKTYRDIVAGEQIKTLITPPDTALPLSKVIKKDAEFPLPGGLGDNPFLQPNYKLLTGIRPWAHHVGYAVGRMIGAKLGICQKSEEKLIHLPGPLVEHWRSECRKELE